MAGESSQSKPFLVRTTDKKTRLSPHDTQEQADHAAKLANEKAEKLGSMVRYEATSA